jgi:hypothetical protein
LSTTFDWASEQPDDREILQNIIASWNPEGAMELQLAMSIATDQWRLNRAFLRWRMTSSPWVSRTTSNGSIMQAKNLQILTLYQQRIHRTMQKNMALLKEMQAEREARRAAEMEEAKRLLQLSEMRNIPYEPTKDGFVFSNDEIYSAINKSRRLERAARTNFVISNTANSVRNLDTRHQSRYLPPCCKPRSRRTSSPIPSVLSCRANASTIYRIYRRWPHGRPHGAPSHCRRLRSHHF